MFVTLSAIFIFLTGLFFAYGAFGVIQSGQLISVTMIGLPIFHLAIGFGLFRWKGWARYLLVYLCFFYILLAILALQGELLLIHYLPFVPFISFLPELFFKFPVIILVILFFILIPLGLILFFRSKSTAVRFEPSLQGKYSWSAPFFVVLAAAFLFSFAFLETSKVSFFTNYQSQRLFGLLLHPAQGLIINYVKFYFPLVLALGLAAGGRFVFFAAIAWALCMGASLYSVDFSHFKSLVFTAGWFLTAVIVASHYHFFWAPSVWLEDHRENRVHRVLLILICSLTIVGLGAKQVWHSMTTKQKTTQKQTFFAGMLQFEGASVDAGGSYVLMNGEILTVGGMVEGYRVDRIYSDHVIVSKEDKKFHLDHDNQLKQI